MIRVCPKRDAICPHGMECPYTVDRYTCKEEPPPQLRDIVARNPEDFAEPYSEPQRQERSTMDKVAGFLSSGSCHGIGDKAHILARCRDLQYKEG